MGLDTCPEPCSGELQTSFGRVSVPPVEYKGAGALQFGYTVSRAASRYSASTEFITGTARLVREPDETVDRESQVFTRLGLFKIDDDLVTKWAKKMSNKKTVKTARTVLEKLEAQAPKKTLSDLAKTEKKSKQERAMYEPLGKIFEAIHKLAPAEPREQRVWYWGAPYLITEIMNKFAYRTQPDMRLISAPLVKKTGVYEDFALWYNQDCWGDIKASKTQGPVVVRRNDEETLSKDLGEQVVDYARLHLSQRPFLLFSVGLVVFGSSFSLAIVDRDGVIFSPTRDIWGNHELLIRGVRSLGRVASSVTLGEDPTVGRLPPGKSLKIASSSSSKARYTIPHGYPTFLISPIRGDPEKRFWLTIGKPLWSSPSLTGRGTWIWRVRAVAVAATTLEQYPTASKLAAAATESGVLASFQLSERLYILKNAWRSSKRASEASIYNKIHEGGTIPGLATIVCGNDVYDEGDTEPISCRRLRGIPTVNTPGQTQKSTTHVCHRLVLNDIGQPLWEFKDAEELLDAMLSVVEAHKLLYERGFIHRDISPGNIMLRDPSDPLSSSAPGGSRQAFLMDVEYAKFSATPNDAGGIGDDEGKEGDGSEPPPFPRKIPRGPTMTGTMQFQARQVLEGVKLGPQHTITQTIHHDIESITLVIAFAVLKHLEVRFLGKPATSEAPKIETDTVQTVKDVAKDAQTGDKDGKGSGDDVEDVEDDDDADYTPANPDADEISDDEDGPEDPVERTPLEKWIKQSFVAAFGQQSIDGIASARTSGHAFSWVSNEALMPDEIAEYFDTPDGTTLRALLVRFRKNLKREEYLVAESEDQASNPKRRRTEAAKAAAIAADFKKRDEAYRSIFSHENLLENIQEARENLKLEKEY
ncbi:hypothetical protein PENSPDRAFT_649091 [Peniophora sp. CONT]|nr:hypothetical protein PENSPDRAFT_649091 [Peniophora sp. CONT]